MHSHYPSQDTSSLSRRKLPSSPGSSRPESDSEGRDPSFHGTRNTIKNMKTNIQPFERFRNLSMPKRNISGGSQSSVRTDKESKQNSSRKESKRNEATRKSLKMSFNSSVNANDSGHGYCNENFHGKCPIQETSFKFAVLDTTVSQCHI